ncbi:MAG: hypothetical protein KDA24_08840 [Deltaproteobacteria bacterium]|nr:hypothetical protein [Deltaproteobacteria bacterium]
MGSASRQLEDLLDLLHVALGDMRLYGARHPMTIQRLHEAWVRLDESLQTFGSLRLLSGHDGLSWEGIVVRGETDDKEGLGRLLHREGIRALTLNQGIDQGELSALLQTLRVNLSLPENEEETLESLLWQVGFQFVEVEALLELREAEVLSGELWRRGDADAAGQVIRQLLSLRVDGPSGGSRLGAKVSEAALHRAVAESDLSGLGGGDGSHSLADHGRWLRTLNTEGSQDHAELSATKEAIASDDPGRLLSRLVMLLLKVALADRDELGGDEALGLARTATDELFRRGLPGGVLALVEGAPEVLRSAPPEAMHRLGDVLRFTESVTQPARVAGMLVKLDPATHTDDQGLARLVNWLPDSTLEQVLESAGRQLTADQRSWLLQILGEAAQERFEGWLDDLGRQPQARIVAIIQLLRNLKSDAGRVSRRELMEHPSREVRMATLEWYTEDLPDADAALLLPSLLDRHPGVRKAALEVFARHRHPKAYTWLRGRVERGYDSLDPELKRDLCIALGRVGGDMGIEPLKQIFERKVPVFGGKDASVDLVASSMGLAASGSVQARVALEKGASSLNRTRRAACQEALQRFGRWK